MKCVGNWQLAGRWLVALTYLIPFHVSVLAAVAGAMVPGTGEALR